jgi:hypothetical protein
VVPTPELKLQTERTLGRLGKGMGIFTRKEQISQKPFAHMMIVDEVDETVLDFPYEFQPGSETLFNGIWGWSKYQVIGLTATPSADMQDILEEIVTKPEEVVMLDFKSEYEFTEKRSTLDGTYVILPQGANILDKIIE